MAKYYKVKDYPGVTQKIMYTLGFVHAFIYELFRPKK